ncbi:MAG: hypothetical protein HOW97_02565 [Catenulispora sp.]|nr:hypothetical protein [Catenulispora sp.]
MPDLITDDPDLNLAIRLVAEAQLGSPSFLARRMKIPFAAGVHFLDEMERRGIVGPADGSRARDVYVQVCAQCGRVGRRGFKTYPPGDFGGPALTVCASNTACRKRWPKRPDDEAGS